MSLHSNNTYPYSSDAWDKVIGISLSAPPNEQFIHNIKKNYVLYGQIRNLIIEIKSSQGLIVSHYFLSKLVVGFLYKFLIEFSNLAILLYSTCRDKKCRKFHTIEIYHFMNEDEGLDLLESI